jgi:hypothetical protein
VGGQRFADAAAGAGDDVENAVGQAGFGHDLGELQNRHGIDTRRLDDARVADGDDGGHLDGSHDDRVIPWDVARRHTERLAPAPGSHARFHRNVRAHKRLRDGRVVVVLSGRAHNDAKRVAVRRAVLEDFAHGQLMGVLADDVGDFVEYGRAFGLPEPGPGGETRARAAFTALSTSPSPARGTRARSSPVAGLTVVIVSPEMAQVHFPPIYIL